MRKTIQRIINATTKKIGFLELCCAIFHKPMTDFTFSDPEVRREALAMAVKATKEAEEAAARLADLKEKQEMEKIRHEEELEEESKLSGVKAKAAFFKRRMVIDEAAVNEKKIKQEAALRQAVKKAKMEQEEAIRMAEIRQKTAEEVEKEVLKARKRAEEIEAAAEGTVLNILKIL